MKINAYTVYASLILLIAQIEHPSLARWTGDTKTNTVNTSDENSAIEINLNINLYGISIGTDEIEILDEPKNLVNSRSASVQFSYSQAGSGTETDWLTGSQISDWAGSQRTDTLHIKLHGLKAVEILDLIEKETGKKLCPTDRNKATKALKKVVDNKKTAGGRELITWKIVESITGAISS